MNARDDQNFDLLREEMVDAQLMARGINDERVLSAMRKVPRHNFVPEGSLDRAYSDQAIPLGPGQSISQPYIVALMLQSAHLNSSSRVLDVGTGSGYQTALLAELVKDVYSVEIDNKLTEQASRRLTTLGYKNVSFRTADGWLGWKEYAPYDAIIVSAAASSVPRELIHQLKEGGRLIVPIGEVKQFLMMFAKTKDGLVSEELGGVQFVKLQDFDT